MTKKLHKNVIPEFWKSLKMKGGADNNEEQQEQPLVCRRRSSAKRTRTLNDQPQTSKRTIRTRSRTESLVSYHAKTYDFIDDNSIQEMLLRILNNVYGWDTPETLVKNKKTLATSATFKIFVDLLTKYRMKFEIRKLNPNVVNKPEYSFLSAESFLPPQNITDMNPDLSSMGLFNTETIILINDEIYFTIRLDLFKDKIECVEYMNKLYDIIQIAIASKDCNLDAFSQATMYLYILTIINPNFNSVRFIETIKSISKTNIKNAANDLASALASLGKQNTTNALISNNQNIENEIDDMIKNALPLPFVNNSKNSFIVAECLRFDTPEQVLQILKKQNPTAFGNVLDDVQEQLRILNLLDNADDLANIFGKQLELQNSPSYTNVFTKVAENNKMVVMALRKYYRNVGLLKQNAGKSKSKNKNKK